MKASAGFLHLMYQALTSPRGTEILCSPDPEVIRQALHRLRVEVKDLDLDQLAFCHSPFDPDKLWIVRKEPSDASPP